jgi:hypothetical protein
MDRNEKIKAASIIHAQAREMRGRFLNRIAVIERDIALLLTEYFCTSCKDKRKIFFDHIVSKGFFSLRKKKEVLYRIVKNDYPRYWDKKKEYLKDFDEIADFRNKLAHCVLDVSDEALQRPIEEGISFIDRDECDPITKRDFEEMEVKANMISGCLSEIKMLLPLKEQPLAQGGRAVCLKNADREN